MQILSKLTFLAALCSLALAAPHITHPDQNIGDAIHLSVTGTAGLATFSVLTIIILLLRNVWRGGIATMSMSAFDALNDSNESNDSDELASPEPDGATNTPTASHRIG